MHTYRATHMESREIRWTWFHQV